MAEFFYEKRFPVSVVMEGLREARNVKREIALRTLSNDDENHMIPLVTPYCSDASKISCIIYRNSRILVNDLEIGNLFENDILTAFENGKNLKKHLVHASLPVDEMPGTFSCGRSRCKTCDSISKPNLLCGPSGSFRIMGSFTCTSTNLICGITCLKCGLIYIGETSKLLGTRFRRHANDVIHNRAERSDVALHFNNCCNSDSSNMCIRCVITVHEPSKWKIEEAKLIKRVGTWHFLAWIGRTHHYGGLFFWGIFLICVVWVHFIWFNLVRSGVGCECFAQIFRPFVIYRL